MLLLGWLKTQIPINTWGAGTWGTAQERGAALVQLGLLFTPEQTVCSSAPSPTGWFLQVLEFKAAQRRKMQTSSVVVAPKVLPWKAEQWV